MNGFIVVIVAFATVLVSALAHGQIGFSEEGSGTYIVTKNQHGSGGWEIELTATAEASNTGYTVKVRAHDVGDSIRYVRVTTAQASGVTGAWIIVGITPFDFPTDTIPILHEVKRVSGTVPLSVSATNIGQLGTSLGDPGEITAQEIGTLSAVKNVGVSGYVGDVFSPITANGTGTFGTASSVLVGNDLLADVSASRIIQSLSVARKIGTTASLVDITATDQIHLVSAGEINATITCLGGTTPFVRRIETTGANGTSGDFVGSLEAYSLAYAASPASGLDIAGDLDADIVFESYAAARLIFVGGEFPAGRTIWIGEGWYNPEEEPREMDFGLLGGQIILNGLNPTTPYQWLGPIAANGHTIGTGTGFIQPNLAPYYNRLSSTLGGGAVGLAPFHLHRADCDPPDGYIGLPPQDNTLRLRWYGPLSWASGDPVTVEYRTLSGGTWVGITDEFTFELSTSNPRELRVIPGTANDFAYVEYRVTPTANLKCGGGVVGPPAVYDGDDYLVIFDW